MEPSRDGQSAPCLAGRSDSGEPGAVPERGATHQQVEAERIAGAPVALFQPMMPLLMGGMVMFIVMAMLQPILNMNQLV